MKFFFKIFCLLLALCTPLASTYASCEGTGNADHVLSAWYHQEQNSFILETHFPTLQERDHYIYRNYMILNNNERLGIATIKGINWPVRDPDGSIMDKYSGKGDVGIDVTDEIALIPPALSFQRALIDQKLPRTQIVDPRDMAITFDKMHLSIQKIIEVKLGYQKMSLLNSCPYTLKPQHPFASTTIYRLFFDPAYAAVLKNPNGRETGLGLLPEPFPGDDRSETTVDPQGKCWGFSNQKPILVGFRWVWECQGSGDLTFAVDQLNTKKP